MHGRLGLYLEKIRHLLKLDRIPKRPRRILVGATGGTILFVGIAMILLPGPAFVVIPMGLALLATEFVWAKRYLDKITNMFNAARQTISRK